MQRSSLTMQEDILVTMDMPHMQMVHSATLVCDYVLSKVLVDTSAAIALFRGDVCSADLL